MSIVHPEHVKAETVERQPITQLPRASPWSLASGVGSDDPYEALTLPEPEPEDPPAEQTPAERRSAGLVRPAWMGVALVRRALTAALLAGVALATTGAAPDGRAGGHAGASSTVCSRRCPTPPPASACSPSSGRDSS